jgi:molybdopterin-guanine dinucleotide biosynthesis protein A
MREASRAVVGLVLCGGASRRMGRDKALLPFGDEVLAARVRRVLLQVTPDVRYVAREGQALPLEGVVVRDPAEGLGPLAAVAAGLTAADGALVVVASCDLPLLTAAVVERLLEDVAGHDACVPWVGGQPVPDCAVYDARAAAPAAERLLAAGERRLRALPAALRTRTLDEAALRAIDPTLDAFRDCDTPVAYARALALAGLTSA